MPDVNAARALSGALINYACGCFTSGRNENDAVYQQVTEGRDVGSARKSYSSCGDLAHWLLYRIGSRAKFVNRDEHEGWKVGQNVSLLAFSPITENASPTDQYETGDILVIWSNATGTDAHVMVVLNHVDNTLTTGEYGQPGGAIRTHEMTNPGWIGHRKIQKVLRLDRVLVESENHNELESPDTVALVDTQSYMAQYAPSSDTRIA